ncbi:hypothetical protein OL548_32380 [Lysinibacillus sp. MHQ-1]|nr:hypothetical protein OL548_32380 [Lysinibacillus sp. MHQ-1]
MTSEIATRYFATPKSINDFNPSFIFHWSDKDNHIVNDWEKVIGQFLMIPMAHQMVGDYLVIDEARDEENRRHMLMRPYQVHALQAVEGAAFGWDNKEKNTAWWLCLAYHGFGQNDYEFQNCIIFIYKSRF